MPARNYIPTPLPVRWQRRRYRVIPVLTFVLCSVIAWRLWQAQGVSPIAIGSVDPLRADVMSPEQGIVLRPDDGRERRLYDVVEAGEEVARVRRKSYVFAPGTPGMPATPATTQPASRPPTTIPADGIDLTSDEAEDDVVIVTAPIGGQITVILKQPGQMVLPGEPILTISSPTGITVTTYLRPEQRVLAKRRMPAELRLHSDPTKVHLGSIEQIGPELIQIPVKHRRAQQLMEWGLPVVITLPPAVAAHPGEPVDVRLIVTPEEGGTAG